MLSLTMSKDIKKDDTGDAVIGSVDKDHSFTNFLRFMANNEDYLLCVDAENFSKSIMTEDLVNHIVHGRQRGVLNYDYSKVEAKMLKFSETMEEY